MQDTLGNRMKKYYENNYRFYLTRRTPVIIRIDGRAFHSFTKGMKKPYDLVFKNSMWRTALYLCENIQNAKIAYVQSDEISILMTDYDKLTTSAWFDNNLQKICSVSASMSTMAFNRFFEQESFNYASGNDYDSIYAKRLGNAMFDARAFNIPESDVCNYFIWRQQDATRNSVQTFGREFFTNKELQRINCKQIQDKLIEEKGINWNDCPIFFKRGVCVKKVPNTYNKSNWIIDKEIPVFTQNRNYIEETFIVKE